MAITKITDRQAVQSIDLTTEVAGTLPVPNGGTGAATLTGLVTGNGTGAMTAVAAPSGAVVGTTDAQALTNKTIDGSSNTIRNATGMLLPVQAHARGDEVFTIASGSVTQIAGTTIHNGTYTPAVGDRILIVGAPASTGAGTTFGRTTQPANGIYLVTSNTTNLSLSRADDLSGAVAPAGLSVYSESSAVSWQPQSIWTVVTPSTAGAFTYGTNNIRLLVTGGFSIAPDNLFVGNTFSIWNNTPSISTYIDVNSATAGGGSDQHLTLPAALTDTMVSRTSTDTLTNKSISANQITGMTVGNTSQQSQVVVSATSYYIAGSSLATPTNLAVGSRFRWTVAMAKTAAGTGAFAIEIRRGTAGTVSDTADISQSIGTQTAVVDNMMVDVEVVVTTTGATGAYYWSIIPTNKAITATGFGVATGPTGQFSGTVSSVAMNTASLKFGLSFKATTGTPTITVPLVRAQTYV